MDPLVAGVVLVAAVTHASWNAIAHGIKDKLVAITLFSLGGLLCAIPLLVWSPPPAARSWPYLAASVALHVPYNLLLMAAYRLGDFSQVYPLARGISPLLVTVLSAVLVGEIPPSGQTLGIVIISVGLASLVVTGRRRAPVPRAALLAAAGTGLIIATYSTVDGIGVRLAGSSLGYIAWLMFLDGTILPLIALAWRGRSLVAPIRDVWHIGLVAGAAGVLAHGLVLWAQTRAPLGPVAALRETSIIFGAIIGTVVFHERFGRARILAAALVATGVVVLNVV
jgi:drug/metabolite transporter (DMT)-like permease